MRFLFIVFMIILTQGFIQPCSAQASSKSKLDICIYLYENGEYQKALDSLQSLLPTLNDKQEIAECYKYMAFSSVLLDMISSAKENFEKMLDTIPGMEIDTVMVPPNITVVFKQVKTEKLLKEKEEKEQKQEKATVQKSRTRRLVYSGIFGGACLASVSVSTLFYLKGVESNKQYKNSVDSDEIEQLRRETDSKYLVHYITMGTAILSGGLSLYNLWEMPSKTGSVTLDYTGSGIRVAVNF